MNQLLNQYQISLQCLDVSGAEYLDLLNIRDELANFSLTDEDKRSLEESDQILIKNSALVHQELSRFIDLPKYREKNKINSQQWWWYLDVLSYLPAKILIEKQTIYPAIA